jgi:hypothetical protein
MQQMQHPNRPETARNQRAFQTIRELDAMGDEAEQGAPFAALAAAIDEDRPSDRRRFPG